MKLSKITCYCPIIITMACVAQSLASEKWWKPYDPKEPDTTFHASWNNKDEAFQSSGNIASMVLGPHVFYHPESVDASFEQCVRIGQPPNGASLGDPSCLKYPAAGVVSSVKGTIEFWFKPSVILSQNPNTLSFFKCGTLWWRGSAGHETGNTWMALDVNGVRFHPKFPVEFYEGDWGWHHMAMTYDFSEPRHGRVEFFVDGESVGKTDDFDASGLNLGETFVIGGNGEKNSTTNGFYDEFRISNVVRAFSPRP